jgi:hypothetical protein
MWITDTRKEKPRKGTEQKQSDEPTGCVVRIRFHMCVFANVNGANPDESNLSVGLHILCHRSLNHGSRGKKHRRPPDGQCPFRAIDRYRACLTNLANYSPWSWPMVGKATQISIPRVVPTQARPNRGRGKVPCGSPSSSEDFKTQISRRRYARKDFCD